MGRRIITQYEARDLETKEEYILLKENIKCNELYNLKINGTWDYYRFFKNSYSDNIHRHKSVLIQNRGRPKGSLNIKEDKELLRLRIEYYNKQIDDLRLEREKNEKFINELKEKIFTL